MRETIQNAAPGPSSRALTVSLESLPTQFEIAGASVLGHEHRRLERCNQDAFSWYCDRDIIVAVVADGCGSSRHSEVGASLGARLMVAALRRHWTAANAAEQLPAERSLCAQRHETQAHDGPLWDAQRRDAQRRDAQLVAQARTDVMSHVRVTADAMGGDFARAISDYFLFTLVGAVITKARTLIFTMGDGVVAVNDDVQCIGPFPDNRPPYPAYALLPPEADASGGKAEHSDAGPSDAVARIATPQQSSLSAALQSIETVTIQASIPTQMLSSLMIATDGASELIEAEDSLIPGRDERVGAISQFWRETRYFRNSDAIRRRLSLLNRASCKPDWNRRRLRRERGLLSDDTTLIAIRRSAQEGDMEAV